MSPTNLVYILITITIFLLLVRKKIDLFQTYIFLLPFHSWFINIGLNISAYQVITLLIIMKTVILPDKQNKNVLYFGNIIIPIFLFYSVLDTTIMAGLLTDYFVKTGGFFRREGRFIGQIIVTLLAFAIVPLSINFVKTTSDLYKYFKAYIIALVVLTFLGWLQLIIFYTVSFDIFPLSINELGEVRTGIWMNNNFGFLRMSSLGGEPKGFSMSLVIAYFIILIHNKHAITFTKYDRILKYLFLLTAFLTLSTSGIVLYLILTLFYNIYRFKNYKFRLKRNQLLFGITLVAMLTYVTINYWDLIYLILNERILERNIASEDFDAPIQMLLKKSPEYLVFGSGIGNVHNLAYPYIPPETQHYMTNTIFVAKSGYLKIVSELGIIGFILFMLIPLTVFFQLSRLKRNVSQVNIHYINILKALLFLLVLAFLSRSYLFGELILMIGISNALISAMSKRGRDIAVK